MNFEEKRNVIMCVRLFDLNGQFNSVRSSEIKREKNNDFTVCGGLASVAILPAR
jgi:hypothetical protein